MSLLLKVLDMLRRIIRRKQLVEYLGLKLTQLRYLQKTDPAFPQPVALGKRAIGFWADEVEAYQRTMSERRNEKVSKP